MKTFIHNPTEVEAVQVARPWINTSRAIPQARKITDQSGKLSHFLLAIPGQPDIRAYEDDWFVKYGPGMYQALPDAEFRRLYRDSD